MDTGINSNTKIFFNFKYIGIALIFLIDFNINNIDFLPDIIGVMLISAGIGRICFINENFNDAKKSVKIFYAVAFTKLAFNIIYFIFSDKPVFKDGVITINTVFIIELFEMFLCILIFRKIFKGLEEYIYASGSTLNTANLTLIPKILNIFFVIKFILSVVPHIPALFSPNDYDAFSMFFDTFIDYAFMLKFFLPPCFIIQTFLGLFVMSMVLPFFMQVAKDKELLGFIKHKINSLLINEIFFILKRTLRTAFSCFIAGCVFFIDLQFDNINILPDFMICILFITGITLVKNTDIESNELRNKKLDLYLIINLFISVASYILRTIYKTKDLYGFSEDMNYINSLRIFSDIFYHITVVIFLLIFIEFYCFIKNLQRKHLDFSTKYLNKYLAPSEKNIDKNRNKIFIAAGIVFSVKTLAVLLPKNLAAAGLIIFIHSLVLIIFVVFMIRGLYMIRDNIFSYYE